MQGTTECPHQSAEPCFPSTAPGCAHAPALPAAVARLQPSAAGVPGLVGPVRLQRPRWAAGFRRRPAARPRRERARPAAPRLEPPTARGPGRRRRGGERRRMEAAARRIAEAEEEEPGRDPAPLVSRLGLCLAALTGGLVRRVVGRTRRRAVPSWAQGGRPARRRAPRPRAPAAPPARRPPWPRRPPRRPQHGEEHGPPLRRLALPHTAEASLDPVAAGRLQGRAQAAPPVCWRGPRPVARDGTRAGGPGGPIAPPPGPLCLERGRNGGDARRKLGQRQARAIRKLRGAGLQSSAPSPSHGTCLLALSCDVRGASDHKAR